MEVRREQPRIQECVMEKNIEIEAKAWDICLLPLESTLIPGRSAIWLDDNIEVRTE